MLSTLFPPDPTLTVDNVCHIMEKVKPEERQEVLKEILIYSHVFNMLSGQYSTASEVEAAAVDIYVNCCPRPSWEHLAWILYRHHQVATGERTRGAGGGQLPP